MTNDKIQMTKEIQISQKAAKIAKRAEWAAIIWVGLVCLLAGCVLVHAADPRVMPLTTYQYGRDLLGSSSNDWSGVVDGSKIGMKCDGVTDDTAAWAAGLTNRVRNNGTFTWPGVALVRLGSATALAAMTQLTNVTVRGWLTNDELGMSGGNWKTCTSLVATGQVAYATTATAHGYSAGQIVGVYCSGDTNYGGAITILSAGLDATHFGYNTLGGTPAGAGSGTMQVTTLDFDRAVILGTMLDHCRFYLHYNGPENWRGVQHRLGHVVIKFLASGTNDVQDPTVVLRGGGFSYGVWGGNYGDARYGHVVRPVIDIRAQNIGYGVALWGAGEGGKLDGWIWGCHRGFYIGGGRKIKFQLKVGNFDVAGALGTSEDDGVTNWGMEDSSGEVFDLGSTEGTSYFSGSARYLFNMALDSLSTRVATYRNVQVRTGLRVTDTLGNGIVAMGMTQEGQTNAIIDAVTMGYSIDRSAVTLGAVNMNAPNYELFARAGGIIKRWNLTSVSVQNSATTATNVNCKRDINFPNIASDGWVRHRDVVSDSVNTLTMGGGGFFDDGMGGKFLIGSQTVRRFTDNTGATIWNMYSGGLWSTSTNADYGSPTNPQRDLYIWRNANLAAVNATNAVWMGAGATFTAAAGTNQRAGDTTLVAGTKAVANTTVTANTRVYLTRKAAGGVIGDLTYTVSAGVGFTINSANAGDTSTVSYWLVEVN
jgi:hypothetical protein